MVTVSDMVVSLSRSRQRLRQQVGENAVGGVAHHLQSAEGGSGTTSGCGIDFTEAPLAAPLGVEFLDDNPARFQVFDQASVGASDRPHGGAQVRDAEGGDMGFRKILA